MNDLLDLRRCLKHIYRAQKAAAILFPIESLPKEETLVKHTELFHISPFEKEKKFYSTHPTETTWNPP